MLFGEPRYARDSGLRSKAEAKTIPVEEVFATRPPVIVVALSERRASAVLGQNDKQRMKRPAQGWVKEACPVGSELVRDVGFVSSSS